MLHIFSAGVAAQLVQSIAEQWNKAHPALPCDVVRGGSVDGIRRVLNGEVFDVMVLADNENIDAMLTPRYADGYFVWGGNEMVVLGKGVTADNWKEKLLDPQAKLKHFDPYGDPGGYRAVLAMQLGNRVEPGLGDRLLHHPNYNGLDRALYQAGAGPKKIGIPEDGTYRILYKSIAVASGGDYGTLPAEMNLGDPAYESLYQSVSFAVDAHTLVRGNVIRHGVCIPRNAHEKAAAEEFVRQFLAIPFSRYGFTPVQQAVGHWTVGQGEG